MCEPGEQVLSDVHVNCPPSSQRSKRGACTRFHFRFPESSLDEQISSTKPEHVKSDRDHRTETKDDLLFFSSETSADGDGDVHVTMPTVDEDGDLVVARKRRCWRKENVITIEHAMETTLEDVGLQVWQGCLLLCDFILNHPEIFRERVVMELGGGVGLATIVVAMMASHVFCTDIGKDVLETCQRNVDNNLRHLLDQGDETKKKSVVQVRELDWFQSCDKFNSGRFKWNDKDKEKLVDVSVILAADVVYDDDLTDAFFKTLRRLMTTGRNKTAFIALERRLNFTIDDLDVTCKAYDHYRQILDGLVSSTGAVHDVGYSVQQLPVDFSQCFQYNRTKQLELWQIKTVRRNVTPE